MVIWMCPYFVLVCICMYECMCGLHVCSVCRDLNTYVQGQRSLSVPSSIALRLFPLRQCLALTWNQMGTSKPLRHSYLCLTQPWSYRPSYSGFCVVLRIQNLILIRTQVLLLTHQGLPCLLVIGWDQHVSAFRVTLCCLSIVLWRVSGVSTVTVRTEGKPHCVHDGR